MTVGMKTAFLARTLCIRLDGTVPTLPGKRHTPWFYGKFLHLTFGSMLKEARQQVLFPCKRYLY